MTEAFQKMCAGLLVFHWKWADIKKDHYFCELLKCKVFSELFIHSLVDLNVDMNERGFTVWQHQTTFETLKIN